MVATLECSTSDDMKGKIVAETDGTTNTIATQVFDKLSPFHWGSDVVGRTLWKNNCLGDHTLEKYSHFICEGNAFSPNTDQKREYQERKEKYGFGPVWCGTGCGMIDSVQPVEELIGKMMTEAIEILTSQHHPSFKLVVDNEVEKGN
eukprot:TRINITY_DN6354_c0_g1_i2.p1 TRINITY_DN6354_c0_g1~~TRINITY_DN6354_c0_g1_i2.p1  ORF type:complete len:166 (-),score=43.43 TRINITY_DN6354_c0_g1_i2:247-687(-)